jgi:Flp pilus assembly protein CpaB
MAVATFSTARALRRPRHADPRALVGIFLTLAALAASVTFWVNATDTRPVLIATRDLPAGSVLGASDVGITYVRVDDAVYGAALPADMLDSLVGRQLGEPVHAEQMLARAQLAAQFGLAPDQVAITIPAHPDSAVDGRVQVGDWVQVLVTLVDKVRNEAHAHEVLQRVQVFEVGRDRSLIGPSVGSADAASSARGAITSLTLAVTSDQALQLAEARRSGELDVVLLPPGQVQHQ